MVQDGRVICRVNCTEWLSCIGELPGPHGPSWSSLTPLHLAAQAGTRVMISYTSAQGTAAEVTYEAALCGRALLPSFCSLVCARC